MDISLLKAALFVPLTLLPILNPIGNAPVFASLTGNASHAARNRMAWLVALNSWILLTGALFVGTHVLAFFGISLASVRVGGGLLVAAAGWRYLNEPSPSPSRESGDSRSTSPAGDELKLRSFYPLSFPLTVGPGSLAAAITLGANAPEPAFDWVISSSSSALGIVITASIIYLCYRNATRIVGLLGELGSVIVRRLLAFVLLCVGIEILWRGLRELLTASGLLPA